MCVLLLSGFSLSGAALAAKPSVQLNNPDSNAFANEEGLVDKEFQIIRSAGAAGDEFDLKIEFKKAAKLGVDFTVDPVATACGITGSGYDCDQTTEVETLPGNKFIIVTMPPNRQDIFITIHPLQDAIDEGDDATKEDLEIKLKQEDDATDNYDYDIGGTDKFTTRVLDNDTASIVIANKSGATTSEAGDTMTFTVVLATEPAKDNEPVEVNIESDDTDEGVVDVATILFRSNQDFIDNGGIRWDQPQTITVTGQPDNGDSGPGTTYDISVEPTDAGGFDKIYKKLAKQEFELTNLNTAGVPGTIQLSSATYSGSEALPSIQVRVDRIGGTTGEVTVAYITTDTGSATANTDYTTKSGTLTFPDGGATEMFVDIPILPDNVKETPDETFTFDLSGITGGAGSGTLSATVTILNDDEPGEFNIENGSYTVNEDAGTIDIDVVRTSGSSGEVTLSYFTGGGDAVAGTDYTDNDGTLTFAHNDSVETVTVAILDNNDDEADRTFNFSIGTPSAGSQGSTNSAPVTIEDDDVAGVFSLDAGSYTVDEDDGSIVITVERTGGSDGVVTLNYATGGGDAPGADYTDNDGTLTFGHGDTSETITVLINDNDDEDGDRTFNVSIDTPSNGSLGSPNTAPVTIQDDDAAGVFKLDESSYTVDEDAGSIVITVERTGGTDGEVTLGYTTGGGDADGTDYTDNDGTLTFGNGVTSQTITVLISGNNDDDGDRTFNVSIGTPSAGTQGSPNTAAVTIEDNDTAGAFQLDAASYTVDEDAGSIVITVLRTGGSDGEVTLDYATGGGTAPGADYTDNDGTLTFAHGDTSETITVVILPNAVVDGDRTFNVSISNPSNGGTLGSPTLSPVTIEDNDTAGVFDIELSAYSVNEDAGSITINVIRSEGTGGQVTLDYTSGGGDAVAPTDYTDNDGTLTFENGDTSKSITVFIVDVAGVDGDKFFNVTIVNPSAGALGSTTVSPVTIVDSDTPGEFNIEQPSYMVDEDAGTIVISVLRTSGSSGIVTLPYTTGGGDAVVGTDYTDNDGTLTFADGDTVKTITVAIIDNDNDEADRTFNVAIGTPSAGIQGANNDVPVTIKDDDIAGEFKLDAASYEVDEDAGSIVITVERTGGSDGEVTLDYNTGGGTAPGADYTDNDGTLTFGNGVTSQTITVLINGNNDEDGDRTFNVSIGTPSNGSQGSPNTAPVTIEDNDSAGVFKLDDPSYTVDEDAGSIVITVERTGGAGGEVTLDYTTGGGDAVAGTDYTDNDGTLTFAHGETSKDITVLIIGNNDEDGDRSFNVSIGTPSSGTQGSPNTALVTIEDNDAAGEFNFASATYSVDEDAGTVVITVLRSGGSGGEITVPYTTDDGTAAAGTDYTDNDGTLTFVNGDTEETIMVSITPNTDPDNDRVFNANLGTPSGSASLGSTSSTAVTIEDNDQPGELNIEVGPLTVNEDAGTVTIQVTRSNGTQGVATVEYKTTDNIATAGSDFVAPEVAPPAFLSWDDGESGVKEITIPIIDDAVQEGTEDFMVVIENPTVASLGSTTTMTVEINASDDLDADPGTVSIDPASYTVDEHIGIASVLVTRTGGSDGVISANWSTAAGTAGVSDYSAASGTVSWADQDAATKVIPVAITDDSEIEPAPAEQFTVVLSGLTAGVTPGNLIGTVSITDNDEPSVGTTTVAFYDTVEKDGVVSVMVNRSGGQDGVLVANWTTADVTAIAGGDMLLGEDDYVTNAGTLSWADGETDSKQIDITIKEDLFPEPTEELKLVFSFDDDDGNPVVVEGTITIYDNDSSGELTIDDVTVSEERGVAILTVRREGSTAGLAFVRYMTVDGTARDENSDFDYFSQTGEFSWSEGEGCQGEVCNNGTRQIEIRLVTDFVYEGPETFTVELFNEQGSDGTASSIDVTKRVGTVTITSPTPIPTLNQWMLMLLALLLGAVAYHQLRRRNQS